MYLWRFFSGRICQCPTAAKAGKALGPDSLCPELILHAGSALKSWLNKFLSFCMCQLKLGKYLRRTLVIAISKPNKPEKDPKSNKPISLLCVPFKILKRLIYACVEPIIDPLLPREQDRFWHERSTIDQATLLTLEIKNSFLAKKKGGTVFVDLTAYYNTVWHCGLSCKLHWILR